MAAFLHVVWIPNCLTALKRLQTDWVAICHGLDDRVMIGQLVYHWLGAHALITDIEPSHRGVERGGDGSGGEVMGGAG